MSPTGVRLSGNQLGVALQKALKKSHAATVTAQEKYAQLSPRQRDVFVEALRLVVAGCGGSREKAVAHLETTKWTVDAIMRQTPRTVISREEFDKLAAKLKINVSAWDVTREL